MQRTFAQQRADWPLLARSKLFWGYAGCVAFSVGAFYIYITSAPFVLGAGLGLTPAQVGISIGLITGGFVIGNFVAVRFARSRSLIFMTLAGRYCGLAGLSVALALCLGGWVSIYTICGGAMCVGFGNGVTLPSANAGALSVQPELAGSASGLAGAIGVATGALLTWLTGLSLTAQNSAVAMLGIMLASVLASLACAMLAARGSREPSAIRW